MDSGREDFANNIEVLKAALVGERGERIIEAARAARAEAELAVARAKASDDQALIAHQQLRIEKLTRQLYGPRSERTSRVLDQIELRFEELESSATEDEIAAEMAVAKTTTVAAFTRKRPARKPLPEHLPRERVIVPGPTTCLCCGGKRLRKLGETVTETLESVPRQWKVIQHVREKFTCRDCEKISQSPAPFHVIARGWAGPSLLAMILFEKFGQHQPLNRQAERYAREGVPLSLSTLADQVRACCAVLAPPPRRGEAQGARSNRECDLAAGRRGGPPHRRAVRDRTHDGRPKRRTAAAGPAGGERAADRRSRTLAARGAPQAVARQRPRQSDGLSAEA